MARGFQRRFDRHVEDRTNSGSDEGWFVGERTSGVMGPLSTQKMLEYAAARGDGSTTATMVWRRSWADWRSLESLREVRALRKAQRSRGSAWMPGPGWSCGDGAMHRAAAWIISAEDDLEVVAMTLHAAVKEMRATVGLAHFPSIAGGHTRAALSDLTTRIGLGRDSAIHLGKTVERSDEALRAARLGVVVTDREEGSRAANATAARLGEQDRLRGVALVPIYVGTGLAAVLELGKLDRSFRRADRAWLKGLARTASAKLARLD